MAKEPKPAEETPAEASDTAGLVEVTKDGETLFVNPACLYAHELLGWRAV